MACPDFVELAEAGITTGPRVLNAAEGYFTSLKAAGVDTLVLGCTHYPLLQGVISYVMGEDVTLVSSSEETAKTVYRVLVEQQLERDPEASAPEHQFRSTGDAQKFAELARRFLGPEVKAVGKMP